MMIFSAVIGWVVPYSKAIDCFHRVSMDTYYCSLETTQRGVTGVTLGFVLSFKGIPPALAVS